MILGVYQQHQDGGETRERVHDIEPRSRPPGGWPVRWSPQVHMWYNEDGIESVSIIRINNTRDDPTRQDSKKRIWQNTKRGHMYIQFFKSISSSFPLLNLYWIENTNVVHLVWRTKLYDQHSGGHLAVWYYAKLRNIALENVRVKRLS